MSIDIWPKSRLRKNPVFGFGIKSSNVEQVLSKKFENTYPVICSSARSCINLLLEYMGFSRNSLVKVPAYASHCVLEAVSRTSTPVYFMTKEKTDLSLVYHQWGIPQEFRPNSSDLIIEDACDSIYQESNKMLFLNGNFEIWSLPKILGCSAGGVLWCRLSEDAEKLKELRDLRSTVPNLQWYLRLLGSKNSTAMKYWNGIESISGQLPSGALSEILYSLDQYELILNDRKKRVEHVENFLNIDFSKKLYGRLPACLPIHINASKYVTHNESELNIGFRHFERINSEGISELKKVLPLPVHQDMPLSILDDNLRLLKDASLAI